MNTAKTTATVNVHDKRLKPERQCLMTQAASENATEQLTMDAFLQSIERKAYRMAQLSLSEHADAIDVIQDSMIKLVTHYSDRPPDQWKPLFYRILQNRIRDYQRQYKMKNMLFFWRNDDKDEELTQWAVDEHHTIGKPEEEINKSQMQASVLQALHGLPEKQRQCFLMRSWEGMSVIDTAAAMGCSEGTVKTHYFRAVTKLRELLGEEYDVQI